MKKITVFLFLLISLMAFTGCANFHDGGGSVWQGGMWVIPALLFALAAIFMFIAIKSWNSGTMVDQTYGQPKWEKNKTPLLQIPQFWFSVVFIVAAIVVIIARNADK